MKDDERDLTVRSDDPSSSNLRPSTFLIVRTDRLGDVVLTLPMASAIKIALPDANVVFLAREYTRQIVERAHAVDEVLIAEDGIGLLQLIRLMRRTKPNVAFFPSPRFQLALAGFLARIPVRIGTGYRWYSFLFNKKIYEHRKTAERHEAEYNLRMLSQIGIAADPNAVVEIKLRGEEVSHVNDWLREQLGINAAKYVVLHAVCGGSTQEWPADRFIELGILLKERLDCAIILTGTEGDRLKLDDISSRINAHLFVGKSLPELAALLSSTMAVISLSTGPGHLAAALGAPTIGIFALPKVISKERWGFRGKHVSNIAPEPISGCPNCSECSCMERIDARRVAEEVETLIRLVHD